MVSGAWLPDAGDFVWLMFDPQAGREQAGRRPALVLSQQSYNAKSGLAIVCPVTTQVEGYPFRGRGSRWCARKWGQSWRIM